MKQTKTQGLGTKVALIILVLFGLAIIASISATIIMLFGNEYERGNIAIIPLEGVIVAGTETVSSGLITSDRVIDDLERAEEDDGVQGIILLINSPGGSAVASDEIAAKVSALEKPVAAVIREVGASGAYWVA
ncbi:signal peptide peptidase SppA, partial [Candidatus Woesearchaeota archaeon]